jgi:hypothetical protein
MKLNRSILAFQSSQALSSILIASFVTMFLLQWERGVHDVASGSMLISCMTLLWFFLINILSRYYTISLKLPIILSWISITIIGIWLYFFPEYGRLFYGLFGLSVWLYYSWANLIMIQEVDTSIRAYHTAVMQSLWGLIGIGWPLLLWLLFSFYGPETTYNIVFILIICSGCVWVFAGLLFHTKHYFTHHSTKDLLAALPKINKRYFIMIGAMWAWALKSQLDIIIPHTIDLSEVSISYILAGLKFISLIVVFLSWKLLSPKWYSTLITGSMALLISGTLLFVLFYNSHTYSVFAMTSVIWSTLFAFVYTVISTRWIETMQVDNRAIGLRGEIVMAWVRVVLASIMLSSATWIVVWKIVLLSFMVCLVIWGIITKKQWKILFPLA